MIGLVLALIWTLIRTMNGVEGMEAFAVPADYLYLWYWVSSGVLLFLVIVLPIFAGMLDGKTLLGALASFTLALLTSIRSAIFIFAGHLLYTASNMPGEHTEGKIAGGIVLILLTTIFLRSSSSSEKKSSRSRSSYRSRSTKTQWSSGRPRTQHKVSPATVAAIPAAALASKPEPKLLEKKPDPKPAPAAKPVRPPPPPRTLSRRDRLTPPPAPKGKLVKCSHCDTTQYVVLGSVSATISCKACGAPIPVALVA